MKEFILCSMLALLFSTSVGHVQSIELIDVHLNLWLGLTNRLADGSQTGKFRSILEKGIPLLTAKNIGVSVTVLLFEDNNGTTNDVVLEKASNSLQESATLIQEHTFTPAMTIDDLVKKGSVHNMNGNKIIFERIGDTVKANGRVITEKDIKLDDNIIAHRIAQPLAVKTHDVGIVEAIVLDLVDLLQIQELHDTVKSLLDVVNGLLETLLTGQTTDQPLTFMAPDSSQGEALRKAFSTTGLVLFTPAFKYFLQKNTFPGSVSPQELSQKKEMTNIAGETVPVTELEDGFLRIGENKVNPNELVAAKNGFVYNTTPPKQEKVEVTWEKN